MLTSPQSLGVPSDFEDNIDETITSFTILFDHAVRTPHAEFLVESKDVSLTYRQAYILVKELVPERLRGLSPAFGSRLQPKVVLLSPNNVLFPLALWSLWGISATVVPISASAEPSLWAGMIHVVAADVVIVAARLRKALLSALRETGTSPQVIDLESVVPQEFLSADTSTMTRASDFIPPCLKWLEHAFPNRLLEEHELHLPPSMSPDLPAVTLFTSSAVDPSTLKCVSYTHSDLIHSGVRAMEMLGGKSYSSVPKRHLGWMPLSHCFEFCITLCGVVLHTGGAYIFFDREVSSPHSAASTPLAHLLLSALQYHQPVHAFCAVPAIFSSMVQLCTDVDLGNLRNLKSLGIGGAATSEALFNWAAEQGIPYFDCSGATEGAGTICIRRALVPFMRQNGLQVIRGLMGMLEKVRLEDDFGELIISGTHLPRKYDNRDSDAFSFDSATRVTTYRTGDLYSHRPHIPVLSYCRGDSLPSFDPSREPLSGLSYLGRVDDMVVFTSGVKVDALALERMLDAHPDVLRSGIIGNISGDALLVFVQPQTPMMSGEDQERLIETVMGLNFNLPFEKRLRKENIHVVKELPITSKLTLHRKKLKKMVAGLSPPQPALAAASLELQPSQSRSATITSDLIPNDLRHHVEALLGDIFSIHPDRLRDHDGSLADIPLTSLSAVQLAKALQSRFHVEVTSARLYGVQNIDDLCLIILQQTRATDDSSAASTHKNQSPGADIDSMGRLPADTSADIDLVISGAACRFPGGIDSLSSFWSALLAPEFFIDRLEKEPPKSRWTEVRSSGKILPMAWLHDVFNNLESITAFFGLMPSEASAMSPNGRLALQLGYEAVEDAGLSPRSLKGRSWGVFSSVNDSGWRERQLAELGLDGYAKALHGSADDAAGARLSYFLDLIGPAIEIKTACSSSAVAIHQACSAIKNGDCDAAIVVASATHFFPAGALFRSYSGIASPSGRCATFSDAADGFLPSEGAAAIVIQRASDAQCDSYARIRATSVMQDGRSHGFFAPNPRAQKRLLEDALRKANCTPDDISYLEAHGTGTQIGDAIELQAINEAFGAKRTRPLHIGAVKAVIGHTEECAGLAGVLKAVLCLKANAIPPQPNLTSLNETIDFEASNVVIPTSITAFFERDRARLIGVSSFGLSGTLAHVVLEEPRPSAAVAVRSRRSLFLLSARSIGDFQALLQRYLLYANSSSAAQADLEAVCRTTQIGRDHFSFRCAWAVRDWRSLRNALQKEAGEGSGCYTSPRSSVRLGLWFGLPLSKLSPPPIDHPLYRSKMAECQAAGWAPEFSYFMWQLSVAKALLALGCRVSVVGGEGIAEYVAAVCANVVSIDSVFRFYGTSSDDRMFHSFRCPRQTLEEHITEWRSDELSIRGKHGADLFSIVGSSEAAIELAHSAGAVFSIHADLSQSNILSTPASLASPTIPIVSGHLGVALDDTLSTNENYWRAIDERTVDSQLAWETVSAQCDVVVNIGVTDDIGSHFGGKCISVQQNSFEDLVGRLFEKGCDICWPVFASDGPTAHVPTYCWSRDDDFDMLDNGD